MSALTPFWVDRKGFVGAMHVDIVYIHDSFDTFRTISFPFFSKLMVDLLIGKGSTCGYVQWQWAIGILRRRFQMSRSDGETMLGMWGIWTHQYAVFILLYTVKSARLMYTVCTTTIGSNMKCSKYQKPPMRDPHADKENAPAGASLAVDSQVSPQTTAPGTPSRRAYEPGVRAVQPDASGDTQLRNYGDFFTMWYASPSYQRRVWVSPQAEARRSLCTLQCLSYVAFNTEVICCQLKVQPIIVLHLSLHSLLQVRHLILTKSLYLFRRRRCRHFPPEPGTALILNDSSPVCKDIWYDVSRSSSVCMTALTASAVV